MPAAAFFLTDRIVTEHFVWRVPTTHETEPASAQIVTSEQVAWKSDRSTILGQKIKCFKPVQETARKEKRSLENPPL